MKSTITCSNFRDHFIAAGRKDQFSYAALGALFEHLEELEYDTGEEIELDVVALCCDYAEHADAVEAAKEYGWEGEDAGEALEWLRDRTTVIEFGGGIIIGNF